MTDKKEYGCGHSSLAPDAKNEIRADSVEAVWQALARHGYLISDDARDAVAIALAPTTQPVVVDGKIINAPPDERNQEEIDAAVRDLQQKLAAHKSTQGTDCRIPSLSDRERVFAGEPYDPPCSIPPKGWRCTRKPGHEGPCAAIPETDRIDTQGTDGLADERSINVPEGQTPLDADLGHRYLAVFNEGIKARDDGTGSPYHGHSLEHCLHAAGWVQRDLRLALDKASTDRKAIFDEDDLIEEIAEAISETFDVEWTAHDGARNVVGLLELKGLISLSTESTQ